MLGEKRTPLEGQTMPLHPPPPPVDGTSMAAQTAKHEEIEALGILDRYMPDLRRTYATMSVRQRQQVLQDIQDNDNLDEKTKIEMLHEYSAGYIQKKAALKSFDRG